MLLCCAACEQKLETGYSPHRLNASDAERRAYYAPPFSPEASPDKQGGGGGIMPNLAHP